LPESRKNQVGVKVEVKKKLSNLNLIFGSRTVETGVAISLTPPEPQPVCLNLLLKTGIGSVIE